MFNWFEITHQELAYSLKDETIWILSISWGHSFFIYHGVLNR